jgi:6-pyruvoyltetrahydropterin/6-carboxytetrahydropterin synthase
VVIVNVIKGERKMIEVMKEFKLRCAHKLSDLKQGHKCMKLHGEYYGVRLYIRKRPGNIEDLPAHGMLIDFGDIKTIFNEKIFNRFDHATLIKKDDPLVEILREENQKLVILDHAPTAEYLSEYIYRELIADLPYLYRVEVIESEGCFGAYEYDYEQKGWV